MTDSRRYEHDCDDCKYLGQFYEYDAYYCPVQNDLIARYGKEGEYISMPVSVKSDYSPIIRVVRAMANAMPESEENKAKI